MVDISEGIQFRREGVDPSQWPKLTCSEANQLALEVSSLRLDAQREILFQGNGQLTASGDMLFLTGNPSSTEKLRILANGNVGIGITTPTEKLEVAGKIKASQIDVSGTVKAATFQGDGSALTGKVSTAGDTINGSLTIQNALTVSGNVGIGTTNPTYKLDVAGDIKASSIYSKPKVFSFKVDGDFEKFYPVVFYDDNWNDDPAELEINRPSVHTDSELRGALNSRFTFHSSSWGNGADFCKAEIYYSIIQFIAGYENYYFKPRFIVWLRGGGTTYYWRSNVPITLGDYSALEKVVEINRDFTLRFPETAVTYPVKINIEPYVHS